MRTRTRYPKGTWMKLRSPEMLRIMMRDHGFSMARLARYADCSKSMISHLCEGRKSSCSQELAVRIAEAFGVSAEVLFEPRASAVSGRNITPERMAS